MLMYANIIIDISHESVDRIFQYRIPAAMTADIKPGQQVQIPFGNGNRMRKGYVVGISATCDYDEDKIKEIAGIVAGSITAQSQLIQLAWWMKERYGATMNQTLKTVLPVKKKVKSRNQEVIRGLLKDGYEIPEDYQPAVLNMQQQQAAGRLCRAYDAGDLRPALIYGVTGSGKTEVYMEMITHVIAGGRQVIVLIPEISLTYQTVMRFYHRFGEQLSIIHSKLSAGERYDQFERARKGETHIMIGPRSALFAPFPDLGLIVMDEEHEGAYKSETTPRFHARDVAEKRAAMSKAAFLMGSATPSLEAYTKACAGLYHLHVLDTRARPESELPTAEIVDLREELKAGNKSIFSRRLKAMMEQRLLKKEQIMLFINRRGYSSFVSCRSCGAAIKCPHCDVSLTLHGRTQLRCHYCGHSVPLPKLCPGCGSPYIAGFGVGTQKIEELARQMFPEARILRMDMDTTRKKGGHEAILAAFSKKQADILIGTQMIVKGHDFPDVTLVGALAADTSLYAPDYRCAERTFQLLVQAAGRAGRGQRQGQVVIQTYAPDHYSIQAAAQQDYPAFYRQELSYRKLLSYPPVSKLFTLMLASESEAALEAGMSLTVGWLGEFKQPDGFQIIGPVPAPIYKVNDIYRKIIYMKHENYDILIGIQKLFEEKCQTSEWFKHIFIQYDFS